MRRGGRLTIELAGLCQVGLAEVEILGREELARLLTDRAGKDRGIDANEAARVVEVVDRLLDLVAHARNRDLLLAAEPEMPMLEEEGGAMLLR